MIAKVKAWAAVHSKLLGAIIPGALGEAITDGLLPDSWSGRGHFVVFLLTSLSVYFAPKNAEPDASG